MKVQWKALEDKLCYICGKNLNNEYHSDYANKPLCIKCGNNFEGWKKSRMCLDLFKNKSIVTDMRKRHRKKD